MTRRLLINVLSNYVAKGLTLIVGFLLTPFILAHVGVATYGLWVLVSSVIGYGSLLELGIAGALIKYVAEYDARDRLVEMNPVIGNALSLYTAAGVTVTLFSLALLPAFPQLFHVASSDRATTQWLILLIGVNSGLAIPCTTSYAVIRGLQRFDVASALTVTAALLGAIVTVAVLIAGAGILGIVIGNTGVLLIVQVPAVLAVHRLAPELRLRWRRPSRRIIRQIISYSVSTFVINTAGILQTGMDEIVIGGFLGVKSVTPYSIAQRLSSIAMSLTDQFMKVLLPLSSQLHGENDAHRLRIVYVTSTRVTLALFIPIGAIAVVLAGPILTLWVGSRYSSYSYLVAILGFSSLMFAGMWPAGNVLQGIARHHFLALSAMVSGVVNLVLSLILVRAFGLAGVALGTLIPTTMEAFVVFPYTFRLLDLALEQGVEEICVPVLVPAVPTVLTLYGFQRMMQPTSLVAVATNAALSLLVYVVAYLGIGARGAERHFYVDFARRTRRLMRVRSR